MTAEMLAGAAVSARNKYGINTAGLSGGVYQNRRLLYYMIDRLEKLNVNVITHKQVPSNDGGLSLGQAVIAGMKKDTGE